MFYKFEKKETKKNRFLKSNDRIKKKKKEKDEK